MGKSLLMRCILFHNTKMYIQSNLFFSLLQHEHNLDFQAQLAQIEQLQHETHKNEFKKVPSLKMPDESQQAIVNDNEMLGCNLDRESGDIHWISVKRTEKQTEETKQTVNGSPHDFQIAYPLLCC